MVLGAITAILLLAGLRALALRPKSLQDFDERCTQTTDRVKRQKIALAAVTFLMQQRVPASIVGNVEQAVAKEIAVLDAVADLPPAVMNDSIWALSETRLKQFLPTISILRKSVDSATFRFRLAKAQKLAKKIDDYMQVKYWAPLLHYLQQVDSTTWQAWRAAALAAGMSMVAYQQNKFEQARLYAVYGLQSLAHIPDRRLFLDLCLRLQNAIAYEQAVFSLAFAFGEMIHYECLQTKYYLRAASINENLGIQLFHIGRYDEAIERLKSVLLLYARWPYIQGMEWYRYEAIDFLVLAMRRIGESQATTPYLELLSQTAKTPREKALYHLGQGLVFRSLGEFIKAEREYEQAIKDAQDQDVANMWYAYSHLAELYLQYDQPEKSLKRLEEGKAKAESKEKDFFNAERMCNYLLLKAQAQIKIPTQCEIAKETLAQARNLLASVNSYRLRIDNMLTTASLYQTLNKPTQASGQLQEAISYCRQHGLFLDELKIILKKVELLTGQQTSLATIAELSQVIYQLQRMGDRSQLIHAHALLLDAAYKANQLGEARRQANLLLTQTEALSRLYDQEDRLIFFNHSIYKDIKSAIQFDIWCGRLDSAMAKLCYVKGRALRQRMAGTNKKYVNIAELRQNLQEQEAVIDYMVTPDTLYVFVLSRASIQLARLPVKKQDLQADVDAYLSYLKNDSLFDGRIDQRKYEKIFRKSVRLSNRLYQNLFAVLAPKLQGIDRLYVVPDEFLYAIPFNTLALQDRIETRFLIQDRAIMVLAGAWMLAGELTDSRATPAEAGLLASIDPNIDIPDVPVTERLVEHLKARSRADIQTAWENKSSFMHQLLLHKYRHYIFYAHAKADWEEPRRSWIAFPLRAGRSGSFSYQEVDSLDWLHADWVILAGCETSGTRMYLGAGLAGLQRAFLAAGARQVLATLWKVRANYVAEQIPDFLKSWDQHQDTILALQVMQKMAIERLSKDPVKYPHPQLWGAYNLTGFGHRGQVGKKLALN